MIKSKVYTFQNSGNESNFKINFLTTLSLSVKSTKFPKFTNSPEWAFTALNKLLFDPRKLTSFWYSTERDSTESESTYSHNKEPFCLPTAFLRSLLMAKDGSFATGMPRKCFTDLLLEAFWTRSDACNLLKKGKNSNTCMSWTGSILAMWKQLT